MGEMVGEMVDERFLYGRFLVGGFWWAVFGGRRLVGDDLVWAVFGGRFLVGGFWWAVFGGRFLVGGFWWAVFGGRFLVGGFWWAVFGGRQFRMGDTKNRPPKTAHTNSPAKTAH